MPDTALIDQYQGLFLDLLPRGNALTRALSGQLAKSARGFAVELARVHEKLDELYTETYPGTATLLLEDWEELLGLPDACTHPTDIDLRRAAVIARMGDNVGQSLLDFQSIAALYGYPSLTMGTYGTFRTGVHPIGHKPIYSDEWLFGSQVSYEVADPADTLADAALECKLLQHAHIHTQMNFNAWDATPVAAMSNLFHHFVCGEYVTHDDGSGNLTIDSWTNRQPYDDFEQFGIDGLTARAVVDEDGWLSCQLYNLGNKQLGGIYIGDTHSTSNMLRHNDYTFWIAFRVDLDYAYTIQHILDSGGWDLYLDSLGNIVLDYDGSIQVLGQADIGPVNVLCITHSGTVRNMQLNGGTPDVDATAGSASGSEELILGASQFHGTALEIIGANYEGPPGTTASVDAVTDYLIAKYR